jgi:glucose/arabinose dehydrogenase
MDVNSGAVSLYASGYPVPTGIAFRPGTHDLYVSSRVVNENVGGEAQVSIVNGRQIIGGLPCCYTYFHSANGIAFGPDGMGYVGVGARADHGEVLDGSGQQDTLQPYEASILRFNPDTGEVSVYARGFRNPYDIAWDANGQLWATDNTPDYDPPERLHRVVPGGQHGYPWYDCDVCFSPPPDVTVIPPLVTFAPSASPTGITAYLANQFPGYYNSLFVTLWSAFPGAQKVMHIGAGGSAPVNFATGFAAPIDVTVGPDGSLYVADWATGIIFKISYTG